MLVSSASFRDTFLNLVLLLIQLSTKSGYFVRLAARRCPMSHGEAFQQKGASTFAALSGKNSRQTQVIINLLSDNDGPSNFVDAQKCVLFAQVIEGMGTVVNKRSTWNIDTGITVRRLSRQSEPR